jgi:hypothetical protein
MEVCPGRICRLADLGQYSRLLGSKLTRIFVALTKIDCTHRSCVRYTAYRSSYPPSSAISDTNPARRS